MRTRLAILILAIFVGEPAAQFPPSDRYVIAVGRNASVQGSYSVAFGDGVSVIGDCRLREGTLGEDFLVMLAGGRYGDPRRVEFATAPIIERHCRWPAGTVERAWLNVVRASTQERL